MAQVSPDVTIARWRKYGKDRLYVTLADGRKIGYWDLVTDEPHPEKPELAEAAGVGVRRVDHGPFLPG